MRGGERSVLKVKHIEGDITAANSSVFVALKQDDPLHFRLPQYLSTFNPSALHPAALQYITLCYTTVHYSVP